MHLFSLFDLSLEAREEIYEIFLLVLCMGETIIS